MRVSEGSESGCLIIGSGGCWSRVGGEEERRPRLEVLLR